LEGVPSTEEYLTTDEELQLLDWVYRNAKHHWMSHNGPLVSAEKGGVDLVVIDDPSLSSLAIMSKEHDHKRPVIFHSRMNIRDDLPESVGNLQTQVFEFIWSTLKHVDILACQATSTVASQLVPRSKVGYMLASTDK